MPERRAAAAGLPRMAALAAGLALGLWGCAGIPARQDADWVVDVPPSWSGKEVAARPATASLASWWLRFDDPLLVDLVASALQSNTTVRSAQGALRQARALRDGAAAGLLPQLGTSASAQRSKAGTAGPVNNFKVGLDASWEADLFGANRSALDASESAARASDASLADVQVSIAAEVALSYITLRSTQARLAIAQDNLASQRDTLQITQWRLQAGLVSSLAAEQARASAEQTAAQLPLLITGIAQAQHALAVLTGQAPAALSTMLQTAAPVPQAAENLALSLPADTLRQRPDVRAAQFQVAAAAARVSQAEAARLPDLKLSGSLGLNALTVGALGGSGALVASILAGVSMPLFDGGAGRAQVQAQQGALEQSRAAYQAAVLTALKDVEDALIALSGDRERLAGLQRAAISAGRAAALARQQFSSGLVDFQTVLETQRSRLSTEDAVATANADVSADHVRLYKALGGGWAPDATGSNPLVNEKRAGSLPGS
jgi:multidrug efflux system outer membrane protein